LVVEFPTRGALVRPVRGISFKVRPGQRLGLVGESGSGKSLTALAMMRLIRPPGRVAAGQVRLNGRNLLELDEREMARVRGGELAMVYQNPLSSLNPLHRIGDQIVEAIQAHSALDRREARERAIEMLYEVGIKEPASRFEHYPHQLSGGMRQRVVIAMAMCVNPAVLIADEPTTALDVTTQARIIRLLFRLGQEHQTAVILITHDLRVAAGFCDDIVVMYAGRLVEASKGKEFYQGPVHPYSEALLHSVAGMTIDISKPIPAISGQPPTPDHLPVGCSFHPRCPYAQDVCSSVDPVPLVLGGSEGRFAECHFALERYDQQRTGVR